MAEQTPEWDIFERLEELEEVKPTAQDAAILGIFAFALGFHAVASSYHNPRQLKDTWIAFLEGKGLTSRTQRALEAWLLRICDTIEKQQ